MTLKCLAVALFLPIAFSSALLGQTSPAPDNPSAEQKEQIQKLLDAVAEGLSSVRSPENRAHIAAALGDMTWTRDEKKARTLFETATTEVVSMIGSLDPETQNPEQPIESIQQQRREIMDRLARHDPQLALAFLQTTRLPEKWNLVSSNHYWSESSVELHLASLVASKDPDLALRTSRASLKKGVSHSLISTLHQIAIKDKTAGQTLYKEIVEQLSSTNLSTDNEASGIALNLLMSFVPPQADEDTYRNLVQLTTAALLSGKQNTSFAQNFYSQVSGLMPNVEKYAPNQVLALRRWQQQAVRYLGQDSDFKMHQEINEAVQRGTVADVLALAERYPPNNRASVYEQAAWKAINSGDGERARQIVNQYVTDPLRRRRMLDRMESQMVWKSVSENKIAEARERINKIRTLDQRIQALLNLAVGLSKGKDKEPALDVLGEAAALVNTISSNNQKAMMQLQIAQAYAAVDAKRSAALLRPLILTMNQLVGAAVVLDGYENTYLKDGEWSRRAYSNLGGLTTHLGQTMGILGRHDLDLARALAADIERPEIRTMAQLDIAQAVLSTNSEFQRFGVRQIVITH